jgi:hypothetical protein
MSQAQLLVDRRFWPLFWTQFFGAFNDNFFKSALILFVTYRGLTAWGLKPEQVVAVASAFLIFRSSPSRERRGSSPTSCRRPASFAS